VVGARLARVPPFERGLTLGDFLVPIRLGERAAAWQRNLLMIAAGVLLITLSAQIVIPLPFTPVPITGQTFGVLFTSALLGFRRSLATMGIYLLLGIVGVPVFAEWGSGIAKFATIVDGALVLGARGGYLIGFLFAGALVGRLAELGWDRHVGGAAAAMALGNGVIYLFGVPWLMAALNINLATALEKGVYPFLVGDVIKLALAAGLLPAGWWLVKRRSDDR
jgi:biotin transport system substrate-specific component